MKKLVLLVLVLVFAMSLAAQNVAINDDGSDPNASAMLDVKSTSKGFLPPRIALTSTTDVTTISSPATGLLIYNTATTSDVTPGYYYYNGSSWIIISKTYQVGDFAQGGIVFWVDETGQHGLVCAKEDQNGGSSIRWRAGTNGVTRSTGDGPYAGKANTSIIIPAQVAIGDDGSDYAAQICNDLQITEGGKTYGDWYLPSKEELNLMYQNKATIDATAGANGGSSFASAVYWSSTEVDNIYAWGQHFGVGSQSSVSKANTYRVRAVRAF